MRFPPLLLMSFFALILPLKAQDLPDPRDQPQISKEEEPFRNEYKEVPYEYLEEADAFFNECKTDYKMFNYYNCECLSVKFLDTRIESGPERSKDSIFLAIDHTCKDATYLAGFTYNECIRDGTELPPGKQMEEFCGCFANKYAELFEASKASPSARRIVDLQIKARLSCH